MKNRNIALLIIVSAYLLLSSSILTKGHNWGGDFSGYIMQTTSLVNGNLSEFIEKNTFTIRNSTLPLGLIVAQWGYPLLLAPVYAIFGLNLEAMKAVNIIFYLLFLLGLYKLFERRLTQAGRLLITALFAFSPQMLAFHDNILSDIPFLCLSTLSMLTIERFVLDNGENRLSIWRGILVGCAIFSAFFIRHTGVLLLPTLLLSQAVRAWKAHRRNNGSIKSALLPSLLPYLVFIILALITSAVLPSDTSTAGSILRQMDPVTSFKNIFRYALFSTTFVHTEPYRSTLNILICVIIMPLFLAGLWRNWREDYHFVTYGGLTLGLYILWPHTQGLRYIFAAMPYYLYFAIKGGEIFVQGIPFMKSSENLTRITRLATLAVSVGALLFALSSSTMLAVDNLANRRQISGPFDEPSTEMFSFIATNTPQDSVIAFFKPRVLRMVTGRNAYQVEKCSGLSLADYLVLYKQTEIDQIRIEEIPLCSQEIPLQQVFENQGFIVYQVKTPN